MKNSKRRASQASKYESEEELDIFPADVEVLETGSLRKSIVKEDYHSNRSSEKKKKLKASLKGFNFISKV